MIKDSIKKDDNLLYDVPYQHYTNAIDSYNYNTPFIKTKNTTIRPIINKNREIYIIY